ncbi:hypothetical protein JCM8097_002037 [Rhodosporidiobolus ruineniae]
MPALPPPSTGAKPTGDVPSRAMALAIGLGFLYGYDTGYISGVKAMPFFIETYGTLQDDGTRALSTGTDSLVTSILSAGTFLGALSAGSILNLVGRRVGLAIALFLFAIGVALQTAAHAVPMFAVGRVFAGLGVGGVSVAVPIYQSEISPAAWRGAIISCYHLVKQIAAGLLIAAVVVNSVKDINSAACWQIPIGLQFVWFGILLVGCFILPESPRWLAVKGKSEKSRRALGRLFRLPADSERVMEEYNHIAANIEHERSVGTVSYADLLWRSSESRLPLRVWTGCAIQALQQLSGFYYGTQFFRDAGIKSPFLIQIATNIVFTFITPFGILAVDCVGRRGLMIYGAGAQSVAQLVVAITGTIVGTGNPSAQKVIVAFTCIYLAHFGAIWGSYSWVICAEIIPNAARSKGTSLTTATNWLFNFGIGYATPYLVDSGPGKAGLGAKVFFIWAACCVISTPFAYFFIPETKGLTLEQVDLLYRNSSIIKSNSYRRHLLAEGINEDSPNAFTSAYSKDKPTGDIRHYETATGRAVDAEKDSV